MAKENRKKDEFGTNCIRTDNSKKLKKPKPWKHNQAITQTQLKQMRDEFWDTAPHYGGQKEIWDALRAAAEAELSLAQTIVDSAGIIVSNSDMTICYDERGAKYELPKYVLSEPTNLIREAGTGSLIWKTGIAVSSVISPGGCGGPFVKQVGSGNAVSSTLSPAAFSEIWFRWSHT
ncbi:hypothetical protein E2562_028266 [Oryza meyeriana var. granulata]|uniref:DC-UbP/UBTD2 N-terminal domain-containing protein n=1 Tax=Oryza meyeriana var. granulata TaxID=110450 RepID=A0A6G1E529_9ORYZ|nr:hypothetical protein E2562_028266 [Oryza meyeriana var. granulata]